MKRNSSYILREIAGVPYLLPFGQAAADRKRGVQINESGIYLWKLLERERTQEELLHICAGHYGASPEEIPLLEKDLEQFLWNLAAHGILADPEPANPKADKLERKFDSSTLSGDSPAQRHGQALEREALSGDSSAQRHGQALEREALSKDSSAQRHGQALEREALSGDSSAQRHGQALKREALSGDSSAQRHGQALDMRGHKDAPPRPDAVCSYLKIGGLCLKLIGPPEAFPDSFHAFLAKEPAADSGVHQTVILEMGPPGICGSGRMLLRDPQLVVMEDESHYFLLFPADRQVREAHLAKDAALAVFYCTPPCTDTLREELFHAVRLAYLYLAQKHHMAALHSASILYRDRAWLFSGPSGAGKSTHSGLWNRLLQTPLINGDLNLLSGFNEQTGKGGSFCTACGSTLGIPKEERPLPLIHGLPWCGTSGICDTGTYPLGGIILLKQAGENRIEELSPDKKQLLVMQRLISPSWTAELLDSSLQLAHELAGHILICRLHCTMEDAAVAVMRERIDACLEHDL